MSFMKKVIFAARKNKSFLCVGLDPDIRKIPKIFRKEKYPLFKFNRHIIRTTKDLVCAYKPNAAFYEAEGRTDELKLTIRYIKKYAKDIPVILDAKRGDIGNTAARYAANCFDYLKADAVTLNPYMGYDSIEPFAQYKDKGLILLCLTSNPGSKDFQHLKTGNTSLYLKIAQKAEVWRKKHKNIALVVGATNPAELRAIRNKFPGMPFLVPGLGTQGGDLERSVQYGTAKNGLCVFNVSRKVIFPDGQSAREAADEIKTRIWNQYRSTRRK